MSRYRAVALFVGLSVLWGGTFPAIEVGLEYFPPVLFAAARYDLAAVLLLGYAAIAASQWRPTTLADAGVLLASGTLLVAGNSLLFVGQQYTTGSVASVIYSLIPLLTAAFARVLLPGEGYTATSVAGVLVGLAGVAVVARPTPSTLLSPDVVGKGLVALAAVSVALGSVAVRRYGTGLPDSTFTAWSMLVGAVLLHAFSAAAGESLAGVQFTPVGLLSVAYLGVFATAVAFLIYFFLLDAYGPLEVNLVSYLVPIVATLLGWALLDERVTVWTVGGFCLVLVGFGLLKWTAVLAELRRLHARSQGR